MLLHQVSPYSVCKLPVWNDFTLSFSNKFLSDWSSSIASSSLTPSICMSVCLSGDWVCEWQSNSGWNPDNAHSPSYWFNSCTAHHCERPFLGTAYTLLWIFIPYSKLNVFSQMHPHHLERLVVYLDILGTISVATVCWAIILLPFWMPTKA